MPEALTARSPSLRRWPGWPVYAAGAALVIAAVAWTAVVTGPSKVGTVTVRNTTPFEVTIVMSPSPRGDVTPLGIVAGQRTVAFNDVVDQGRTWYFHLASGGVDGGTLVRSRADLVHDGWTIVVDGQADGRFRAAGLFPDPNR